MAERIIKVYNEHIIAQPNVNPFPKKSQEEMIAKLKELLGIFHVEDVESILNVANQKKLEIISYEIENPSEITFKLKFEHEDSWTEFNCYRNINSK